MFGAIFKKSFFELKVHYEIIFEVVQNMSPIEKSHGQIIVSIGTLGGPNLITFKSHYMVRYLNGSFKNYHPKFLVSKFFFTMGVTLLKPTK
jgi:hypothetical protein